LTQNAGKKLTHPDHIATIGIVKFSKEVAKMIRKTHGGVRPTLLTKGSQRGQTYTFDKIFPEHTEDTG